MLIVHHSFLYLIYFIHILVHVLLYSSFSSLCDEAKVPWQAVVIGS
jgi:hypothetical protein